jgi:uncharacterized repeat protein (TIGR03943 family)
MTPGTQRALQALLLAGLGVSLLYRLWSGTLLLFVHGRLALVVLATAVALLALARVAATPAAQPPADRPEPASAWCLWLVALPLIIGLLVPAHPLGASALATRGLNLAVPPAATAVLSVSPTERTVLDWVRVQRAADDPNALSGQPADVIGFVYHDQHLGADEFIVSRFALLCCAADAIGLGLLVRWPAAAGLPTNAWVRVRGPVQLGAFGGQTIPVINATGVDGIDEPQWPYLYP